MNPNLSARIRRFVLSSLIALPMTVALLFLMMRLILPFEQDPLVTQMIRSIELQRPEPIPVRASTQIFELPPQVDVAPMPVRPKVSDESANRSLDVDEETDQIVPENTRTNVIDWWAEARKAGQESDDAAFRRWLVEQGYERYVSIMQGPLPITNPVAGVPPSMDGSGSGYRNAYGELELQISDNCFMQMSATSHDYSDFARKIPARIVCKPPPKKRFSFDRHDRE